MNGSVFKKNIVNTLYFLIWIFPLFFFIKDFFILSNIKDIFGHGLMRTIWFSIWQSLVSTVLAFVIGVLPGYYAAHHKGILSRYLESTIFIPFFFPVISAVTVFSIIFNIEIFRKLDILYSLKAIFIANVFYNSPIFVKYICDGIKRISPNIYENMYIDGATDKDIFLHGELPIILPQLIRGALLVFTYCLLSFGIILSLGGIEYNTLEIEIATTLMGGHDFSAAMIYGAIQFFILMMVNLLRTNIKEYQAENGRVFENKSVILKVISVLYLIFEYGTVVSMMLFSFWDRILGRISFAAYLKIFSRDLNMEYPIVRSILNSLFISCITGIIVVIFIYVLIKYHSFFTEIIMFSNMGISGAFLGLSLYYLNVLFNIPFFILVMIGQCIIAIPIGYSYMYQHVKKISQEILESAYIDCNDPISRLIYIEFPILKKIFLSCFLQIFAIVFGEFTMVYTMQLEDIFPTVSLVNNSLVANKLYQESSALSTVILCIIILAFALGEYLMGENKK